MRLAAAALTLCFATSVHGMEPPATTKRPLKEQVRPAPEKRAKASAEKPPLTKKKAPPAQTNAEKAALWGSPADHGLGCSAGE